MINGIREPMRAPRKKGDSTGRMEINTTEASNSYSYTDGWNK